MELMGSLFPDEQDIIQVSDIGTELASDLRVLVHLGKVVVALNYDQAHKLLFELDCTVRGIEHDDIRA